MSSGSLLDPVPAYVFCHRQGSPMVPNAHPYVLSGAPCSHAHPPSAVTLSVSPQTKVTGAFSPGASPWKDKATSMSSFSTRPRRSPSVFSNQALTWRGPQGETTGRAWVGSLSCFLGLAQQVNGKHQALGSVPLPKELGCRGGVN